MLFYFFLQLLFKRFIVLYLIELFSLFIIVDTLNYLFIIILYYVL